MMTKIEPNYADDTVTLYAGDCLAVLPTLPDNSVDAVVTDPPYGLEFMGRTWDRFTGEPIDPAFMHWFAGFVDGEGCFSVHKKPHPSYDCQFSISLRADDRPILERIHRTLRMGTLSNPSAHQTGDDNPKARFSVSSQRDCVRLRDLLRAFPLRAKKAVDFEIWSDALDSWLAHERGEWDEMAALRDELMQGRGYKEEGVRVDPFQMWVWRWAREALRVLKPGGHMVAFGATRQSHRLAAGIEDAGFEIRDTIAWLYGSGFPKSLDVSKAIDRAAGAEREVVGTRDRYRDGGKRANLGNANNWGDASTFGTNGVDDITAPATDAARQWQGWGTALKPAHEPVVCARKPFSAVPLGSEANRLHHSLGALLWLSLSSAKRAELTSPSSPAERSAATCASALASAATDTSPGQSAKTDTYSSPALASTFLSIVTSWNATLVALSDQTKTSTTSTSSSTTTALRTLNSLLGPLTSQTTMPACECLLSGQRPSAPNAAARSNAEWASWLSTLSDSVPATATEGIALVVASALADIAAELSSGLAAGSSAHPSATTNTATRTGSGTNARTADSRTAHEPIVVARKPLVGTVAANVLAHGTGALNIDGCRIGTQEDLARPTVGGMMRLDGFSTLDELRTAAEIGAKTPKGRDARLTLARTLAYMDSPEGKGLVGSAAGRWPANVALDETAAAALDHMSGETESRRIEKPADPTPNQRVTYNGADDGSMGGARPARGHTDTGGASRFFYTAKAGSDERPFYWKLPCNCETIKPWPEALPVRDIVASESGDAPLWNTSTSGNKLTAGQSHQDTISTTETETNSTTTRPISNSLPSSNTNESTQAANSEMENGGNRAAFAENSSRSHLSTGTSARKAGPSTADAAPATSRALSATSRCESCGAQAKQETHATVKPLSLMRWLTRLVCPPGGLILEPFAGSGTTVEAAILEGFRCIAIEREADYLPLITQRLNRRRNPVAYLAAAGEDLGLFDEEPA